LGAVLYFMAAGHPPFRAEQAMAILHRICHDRHRPVQEVNPTIPDELSDVIDRLLEKKAARRFASAGEVQQSLAQALAQIQQPRGRPRRWLRSLRQRKRQLLSSAVVLLSVVGAGWLTLRIVPTIGPGGTLVGQSVHTTVSSADPKLVRLRSEQDAYVDETAAIGHSLERIENSTPLALSATGAANDGWRFEVTAADRAAARLEKDWSRDPLNHSSLNSVEGVKP
jgi:serine/threonine protein kinase